MDINTISIIMLIASFVIVIPLTIAVIVDSVNKGTLKTDLRWGMKLAKLHYRHYTKNFRTN